MLGGPGVSGLVRIQLIAHDKEVLVYFIMLCYIDLLNKVHDIAFTLELVVEEICLPLLDQMVQYVCLSQGTLYIFPINH